MKTLFFVLLVGVSFAVAKFASVKFHEEQSTKHRILVLAPHPDDESLMAAGIIRRTIIDGNDVIVAIVTNGDAYQTQLVNGRAVGVARENETVNAMAKLGVKEDQVLFLGYGDDSLMSLFRSVDSELPRVSPAGLSATYGERGLGRRDFHSYFSGTPAAYSRNHVTEDFERLLQMVSPDEIFTTSRFDAHPDHQAVFLFLTEAILALRRNGSPSFHPIVHQAIIHAPNWAKWPQLNSTPMEPLEEPPYLNDTRLSWKDREIFPVPPEMLELNHSTNLKIQAIGEYVSQKSDKYFAYARKDEVFWNHNYFTLETGRDNVAYLTQIESSSDSPNTRQSAASAVDGIVDGCPRFCEHEWVVGQSGPGASIALHWTSPVISAEVILYDRFDAENRMKDATLVFDDGTRIKRLPSNAGQVHFSFPEKQFKNLRLLIEGYHDGHLGLAEVQVNGHLLREPILRL